MIALSFQGTLAGCATHKCIVAAMILTMGMVAGFLGATNLPTYNFDKAPPSNHFADAENVKLVQRGAHIYKSRCASCHGRFLQGQPLWQLKGAYSGQLAAALDPTGSAWKHPDEDLFNKIKFAVFSGINKTSETNMPAFANTLKDEDILAVLAFIKARWPLGVRVLQARQNPGFAGTPSAASQKDWTIPPDCEP